MKKIGILGGLGPETTSNFYLGLNNLFKKNNIRPSILIYNVDLDLEIEKKFLLTGDGLENYLSFLKKGVNSLVKGGVDFIVIPCNSVHGLIEELREYSQVPILSIIEETIKYIKEHNIDNIGLLSSGYTANAKLYEKFFLEKGINFYKISTGLQVDINNIILKLVLNIYSENDLNILKKAIDYLYKKGAKNIILGCTDLQILISNNNYKKDNLVIYDTLSILLNSTYNYSS